MCDQFYRNMINVKILYKDLVYCNSSFPKSLLLVKDWPLVPGLEIVLLKTLGNFFVVIFPLDRDVVW